ncbi:MAG: Crp/Fnr family transcriptional regulator [Planctomycetota bacterium]
MGSEDTPDPLRVMRTTPLFRGLPDEDIGALHGIAGARSWEKGQTIFREGEEAQGFFLVLAGQVKLFKLNPMGKEQILHIHDAGGTFAEATLAAGSRYPASAVATADSTVLCFPRRDLLSLVSRRPAIATNLIARLSQRLREMAALVEDLSLREAPGRLARYLLELAGDADGPEVVVSLPVKKGELAAYLGTRGETLSRVFRKLGDSGAIEVRGSTVTIRDVEHLADIADGETGVF